MVLLELPSVLASVVVSAVARQRELASAVKPEMSASITVPANLRVDGAIARPRASSPSMLSSMSGQNMVISGASWSLSEM